MKQIHDLSILLFGDKVKIEWSKNEFYIGVIFGANIGYADGKIDSIEVIADHMNRKLCQVYLMS
jgi:hypothetical protein